MPLATIDIEMIDVGQRLRTTSEAQVETLIASIGDVGLLNPITVYPCKVFRSGSYIEGFGVVAGAHRLEACKRLGLAEIEANVVSLSDLERQIAECDENLCATTLSKSERALFTKRRKDAYEALHPETKHGGDRKSDQVANLATRSDDRFTADTAAKTGQSERVIQRDAERGSKISEKVLSLVKGTRLDTGAYLDKLKTVSHDEQESVVRNDLSPRKPVPPAPEAHNPFEARNKWAAEMNRAWGRAPQEWRDWWLSTIDKPVMDHGDNLEVPEFLRRVS
jgi:ParB family transcriptional regulator, chromosome partitioning protein